MASIFREKRIRFLCIRFLICAGIVYGTVCGVLYHYAGKIPKDKILNNVYIGETDVSGMTVQEARQALESHLKEVCAKKVTMQVNEKTAEASLEELGLSYQDIDVIVRKAVSYGKVGNIWSRCRKIRRLSKERLILKEQLVLDKSKAAEVLNERVVPLSDHAEDARIERKDGRFRITEEKMGETIDMEGSMSAIEQIVNEKWMHDDIVVRMPQKDEKPAVTSAELETIQDELGTFSTDAGGGKRWQNLKTGARLLDGSVVMPGQKVSVYAKTAPYDAEHGYVEAGSYENGQVVDSYGGGICQVSTTLYNAVLAAELQVVKRYPHSMMVSYTDPSRDAAIAGDYMDFVFQNSYDTPVYIEGEIDEANQLRFTIYGRETRDQGRRIEFQSETLSAEEYETVYRENPEAELGSVVRAVEPHIGTTAQLWKIVYQDEKEVSREKVNSSKYEKTDEVIEIGTATEDDRAAVFVREAIESQSWEKIEEAIDSVMERAYEDKDRSRTDS